MNGPEDLSDDELEARQRAEDGEDTATNPPVENDDTAATDATAAAPEAQAAAAEDGKPDATTTTPPADAAVAPAAGADATDATAKVDGVLSKDGTRVLPYAALQAERRSARAASARAERTERELEEARQQIADLKAGKTPDSDALTEEKVADMEANFPEEGKKLRTAFNRIQELEAKVPKAEPKDDTDLDDPVQDAIDQVPLLVEWQHGDAQKFERAIEHDSVLVKSPKWADKPAVDRFAEAARRVAEEFDIPFEKPSTQQAAAKPAATTAPAVQATRKPPETLSDFKGGSVADHGTVNVEKMSPQALLGRMEDMSDDEIDAHLAKYG